MQTTKLYHRHPHCLMAETPWQRLDNKTLALAESIVFAESGGQLSDFGRISQAGITITFTNAQFHGGQRRQAQGCPPVLVGQEIRLTTAEDIPSAWREDLPVTVEIDAGRRYRLCRSHTAAHLLWLAAQEILDPDLKTKVRGARVEPDGGRFDLSLDRVTPEHLQAMENMVAGWVRLDGPITMEAHPDEPECLWWVFGDYRIPCGGTHVERSGEVGTVVLRRKNKGKGLERVIWETVDAPNAARLAKYHPAAEEDHR